jgi:hypothetical protein
MIHASPFSDVMLSKKYTVKPLFVVSEETTGAVEKGGDKCCNATVAESIKHVGNISK